MVAMPPPTSALSPTLSLQLKTPSYAHNSVAYSPFHAGRLALASGTNFGLSGRGAVHVVARDGNGLRLEKSLPTTDCVFDLSWSESHPSLILAACGDGSCLMFNVDSPPGDDMPKVVWREHNKEVFGVDCSNLDKTKFASCSWDGTIKFWDMNAPQSLATFETSANRGNTSDCVYTCLFSPHNPHLIGSTTSTGQFMTFDLRAGGSRSSGPSRPVISIPAHQPETLTFDWNKYQPDLIATGGVDTTVRVWDLRKAQGSMGHGRMPGKPEKTLQGHRFAVKRVAWSPFRRNVLASTSYDMTCQIWSIDLSSSMRNPSNTIYNRHREFVHGLAWSLQDPMELSTASWDQEVHVIRVSV